MRIGVRIIALAAAVVFALSFFVPAGSPQTPFAQLKWWSESARSPDSFGELVFFGGTACAIAYPYVWALVVIVTLTAGIFWPRANSPWPHIACHSIGGLAVIALSVRLLVLKDDWPVGALVQWTGLAVSLGFLAALWTISFLVRSPRNTWVVLALGSLPHIVIQFLLARWTHEFGYPYCVYVTAGAAAGVLLICSIWESVLKKPRTNQKEFDDAVYESTVA